MVGMKLVEQLIIFGPLCAKHTEGTIEAFNQRHRYTYMLHLYVFTVCIILTKTKESFINTAVDLEQLLDATTVSEIEFHFVFHCFIWSQTPSTVYYYYHYYYITVGMYRVGF